MAYTTTPIETTTRRLLTRDGKSVDVPTNVPCQLDRSQVNNIRKELKDKIAANYNDGTGSKGNYYNAQTERMFAYGANPFGYTSGQHVYYIQLPWNESRGEDAGLLWCSQPGATKMDLYC